MPGTKKDNVHITLPKKHKRLNKKLDVVKLQLEKYVREKREQKKVPAKKALAMEIKEICYGQTVKLSENSLLHYMQNYIDSKKELICHST